jgi:hypothetical protein
MLARGLGFQATLYHEHITLAHKFPKARVIVQRAELEFARNPHPFYVFMSKEHTIPQTTGS